MAKEQWELTREIWDALEGYQASHGIAAGKMLRILKLSEEIGEVSQAVIGVMGANKRKGFTHADIDVAKELGDVIITAMVALEDWVIEPESFLRKHIESIRERVSEHGS
jgi:NTP pyrophosphatase (non-canonical NTP hydrolase)